MTDQRQSDDAERSSLSQPCTLESGDCVIEINELEGYVRYLDRVGQSAPGLLDSGDECTDDGSGFGSLDRNAYSGISDPGARPCQVAAGYDKLSPASLELQGEGAPAFPTRELRISSAASDCSDCKIRENSPINEDIQANNSGIGDNTQASTFSAAAVDRKITMWMKSISTAIRQTFASSLWSNKRVHLARMPQKQAGEKLELELNMVRGGTATLATSSHDGPSDKGHLHESVDMSDSCGSGAVWMETTVEAGSAH